MPEVIYSLAGKRVYVAGHRGMVGSAIVRRLASEGCEILTAPRAEVDLRRQEQVEAWMSKYRPDAVFLAAARVGGILANATYPADFLYDNLVLQANVIHAAHKADVEKLMFLGSSCIYPKFADQPIVEDALLTGSLEPTNEWYAIAKIAGLKLCAAYRKQHGKDFISAMPTNLYGPGDNFDLDSSHVMPALIRKAHEAKINRQREICIWGTGTPRREFLHVDDCADACLHLMKTYSAESHVNIGSGEDIAILELAHLVSKVVGFEGKITHDPTKPDGTPRKLLSVDKLRTLGWSPRIGLKEGIAGAYRSFLDGHCLERSNRAISGDLTGQSDISFERAKTSTLSAPTLPTVAHHPSRMANLGEG
ncbi:GDP-L-fucose synthase [Rhizobium hidalgonense]|uniref:GDP-L-fucose synthase n=1 Tax=Rhizobium hidalgonense TaxID=1538159 RepID=A0AAJ2GLL1_9HYPH|nr:GDP-L-fucose synthase [Rhizobium hidalgonense]MDR9771710.1 GDP-L-fucose synthase [Rhizobium hidalgonense]